MAQTFIETAIEISNDYELDIEIEKHLSHISATYYFDCGACMGFLRRIIAMLNTPPPDGHLNRPSQTP